MAQIGKFIRKIWNFLNWVMGLQDASLWRFSLRFAEPTIFIYVRNSSWCDGQWKKIILRSTRVFKVFCGKILTSLEQNFMYNSFIYVLSNLFMRNFSASFDVSWKCSQNHKIVHITVNFGKSTKIILPRSMGAFEEPLSTISWELIYFFIFF